MTPYMKTKLKWTTDLKVRPETIKLLEENTGRCSLTKILAIFFFDLSPKTKKIKAKIHGWNLIKPKSFCPEKETIEKMKG